LDNRKQGIEKTQTPMGHYSHPPLMKLIMKACFDSKGTIFTSYKKQIPFPKSTP
jgi:hypothetical protein